MLYCSSSQLGRRMQLWRCVPPALHISALSAPRHPTATASWGQWPGKGSRARRGRGRCQQGPPEAALHSIAGQGAAPAAPQPPSRHGAQGEKHCLLGWLACFPGVTSTHPGTPAAARLRQTFTLLFFLHLVPSRLRPPPLPPGLFSWWKSLAAHLIWSSEGSQHAVTCGVLSIFPYPSKLFPGSHTVPLESPPQLERLI